MKTENGIIGPLVLAAANHPIHTLLVVGGLIGYSAVQRKLRLPAIPWTGIIGGIIALEVVIQVW